MKTAILAAVVLGGFGAVAASRPAVVSETMAASTGVLLLQEVCRRVKL